MTGFEAGEGSHRLTGFFRGADDRGVVQTYDAGDRVEVLSVVDGVAKVRGRHGRRLLIPTRLLRRVGAADPPEQQYDLGDPVA